LPTNRLLYFLYGDKMNRKLVIILGFFLVFGIIASNGFAQTVNKEQQLIGTWASEIYDFKVDNSVVITFNQNGTLVFIYQGERMPGKWGAAENKIVLSLIDNDYEDIIWGEFFISGDGRTMVLIIDEEKMLFRKR